jgi:hypothetical protein
MSEAATLELAIGPISAGIDTGAKHHVTIPSFQLTVWATLCGIFAHDNMQAQRKM